ncbi:Acetyltransferase (the isoleucine patch superfamily) protein [Bacillus sp. NRRL B-14911]|uniref:Acetyltransferase n=1 Tax=Bacillus infantis NRRL B-14911 TaxID=1367477 RepID=U5LBX6_9BACI|nr:MULTISPECIES: acetyltransferase [Bacillus]AGX04186.1 acetyltransferase [Bacillus infantis NRRL B-14911]EAR66020.1 Acetyltransferase (the isoleucine patch superfamily) protein [Bacillus sp. NRRL B-14911]
MKKLILWGSGGHAREVLHMCGQLGIEVAGFLDERPEMKGRFVDDIEVLGTLSDIYHLRDQAEIFCASVGDPSLKKRFSEMTRSAGFQFAPPLIHPVVNISNRNTIGIGSVICEGTIMTTNIRIGDHVIINRGTNISHDNIIEDYATISPGGNIAGNVTVKEGAYIGIGSSIREKVIIGAWSMIGGGAFVKDDVPEKSLYAGVPAVFKKRLEE